MEPTYYPWSYHAPQSQKWRRGVTLEPSEARNCYPPPVQMILLRDSRRALFVERRQDLRLLW